MSPESKFDADQAEAAVRLSREDLARRLGIGMEGIRTISVEGAEWRDASLGWPQPGMVYAQVITPGYRVVLESEGVRYEYHTDWGRAVVLCDR